MGSNGVIPSVMRKVMAFATTLCLCLLLATILSSKCFAEMKYFKLKNLNNSLAEVLPSTPFKN